MKITPKILHSTSQKYTLLYVEDDKTIREETTEFLENFFKDVVIAENGEEALALYSTNLSKTDDSFDIVLSDIQMPIMNGIRLSKELMQLNKSQKIIVISVHNETEYFIDLIKIGISNFVQKPLNTKEMLKVLYDLCIELDDELETSRYIELDNGFRWDTKQLTLSDTKTQIELTKNESLLLDLLIANKEQYFSDMDIFNHIHYSDSNREFSKNAIKSLVKRLRQKLPENFINNERNMGYYIKSF
ncbi:MAG: response regulator transcription factor [Campylobacterota bacterium]|nr:response regulator transcription factor [Campylobacterota bacterium]